LGTAIALITLASRLSRSGIKYNANLYKALSTRVTNNNLTLNVTFRVKYIKSYGISLNAIRK